MTVDEAKEYFVKSSLCYENSLLDRCDGCDGCIFEVDPSNFCEAYDILMDHYVSKLEKGTTENDKM